MASGASPRALAGVSEVPRGVDMRGRTGHPWPAPLRAVIAVVTSLHLLYLLAANLVLGTPLLAAAVNTDPYATAIRYASAWTIVPGRVEVTDFTLRFQDHNVQMLLSLDRAQLRVDLLALAEKRFHVTQLRAEGVSLRVRPKSDSVAGEARRMATFAPIPGFDDPPLRTKRDHEEATAAEAPPPRSAFWTLHLEDVSASMRELWLLEARWVGDGDVRGALRLAPMRELDVWPAELRLADGTLTVGGGVVLHVHQSTLDAEVHHVDTRVPKGLEILRFVDGRVQLRGVVASLGPLADLHAPPGLALGGEVGELAVDATLERGTLAQGSTGALSLADVRIGTTAASYRGPLALHADAEASPRIALVARSTSGRLETPGARASEARTAAQIVDAFVRIRFEAADLLDLPRGDAVLARVREAGVEVQRVSVADLGALAPFAPRGVTPEAGEAALAARASYDDRGLVGRLDVALGGARVRVGDVALATSGKLWLNLATTAPATSLSFPGSGADLSGLAVTAAGHREGDLALAARVREATVSPATLAMTATTELRVAPGARVLRALPAFAGSTVPIPPWLARAAAGPEANARLRLTRARDGRLDVHVSDARDGALRARGLVRTDARGGARGALLFEAGGLRAGVSFGDPRSGAPQEFVPLADEGWLAERVRALP